jgi:hypothetical protein
MTSSGPAGLSSDSTRVMVRAVLRRPDLWWAAIGAVRRLAAPGWWWSSPRLPLPDPQLWAFRMVTAYGRPDATPEPSDVISYLEWCRSTARHGGRGDRERPVESPTGRLDATHSG